MPLCLCVCVSTFSYVEKYDLEQPSDDIQFVLKRIAVKLGTTQRVKAITGVGKKKKRIPHACNYLALLFYWNIGKINCNLESLCHI